MDTVNANLNSPGSAEYSPALTDADNAVIYKTRATRGTDPAGAVGDVSQTVIPRPPSPSIGGEPGQYNRLGWSDGFRAFLRRTALTGRVLTRPTMGAHPATGPVGYSTRSTRLRNAVAALTKDYTPSSQAVADEITRTM